MDSTLFDQSSAVLLRYGILSLFLGIGVLFNDRLSQSLGMDARQSTLLTVCLGAIVWFGWETGDSYIGLARLMGGALAVLLPFAIHIALFREIVWRSP